MDDPITHTLNATCTGTSVIALVYEGGVAMATDRLVSYGKMAKFKQVSRQYRVNKHCIVSFGGDHADFQFLQNLIERRQEELRNCSRDLYLTPKMLHAYLTSFFYYRRSKIDPLLNTIVVMGMQRKEFDVEVLEPFIGVITPRGVAYETKSCATGLAAMLLNQLVETNVRAKQNKLSQKEALDLLRKCMELALYSDCCADSEFDLSFVQEKEGAFILEPEHVVGNWDIAETNCQYQ